MADFTFSSENIKNVFDALNNSGALKKCDFPNEYLLLVDNLHEVKENIKIEKDLSSDNYMNLKYKKIELLNDINSTLDAYILKLSKSINSKDFHFNMVNSLVNEKPVYSVNNIESKIVAKHIQLTLEKIFKLKPGNRNQILNQLQMILLDKTPKKLIRTDIKSFYESIPQTKLLQLLENSGLLMPKATGIIKSVFTEYNKLALKTDLLGVPRGISFSAYLAELYLQSFDEEIKDLCGVIFYARYVDDIILVCNPDKNAEELLEKIELIFSKHDLKLNNKKTFVKELIDCAFVVSFAFLGYLIQVKRTSDGKISVNFYLTKAKLDKYKKRILKTFETYTHLSRYKNAKAHQKLIKCLVYLTKNSFLCGQKDGVRVGIFWSNRFLNQDIQLRILDKYLHACIDDSQIFEPYRKLYQFSKVNCYEQKVSVLKNYIKESFSFEKGFHEIRFHRFKLNDYREIHRIFHNEN